MSKYFIQTKLETQIRGIGDSIRSAFISHKWETKEHFDDFEKAEQRVRELIENANIKAKNIRICQVVGEFESNITVKTKEEQHAREENTDTN